MCGGWKSVPDATVFHDVVLREALALQKRFQIDGYLLWYLVECAMRNATAEYEFDDDEEAALQMIGKDVVFLLRRSDVRACPGIEHDQRGGRRWSLVASSALDQVLELGDPRVPSRATSADGAPHCKWQGHDADGAPRAGRR